MAVLNYRRKLTFIVLINIFITNQCQNEYDFEETKSLMHIHDRNHSGEENENFQREPTYIPQYDLDVYDDDVHNTSQETTEKNIETTGTTEYDKEKDEDRNVDEPELIKDDRIKTTVLYGTETSTSYMDNNVYNKDRIAEDIYTQQGINIKQPDYETTQQSTRAGESSEETSQPDPEEDSSGQRNPKTEADSKEQSDKRILEKPRPTPALSKSSTLKSWLEDTWLRPPAGILVPLRPLALTRALAVWNDLTDEGLNMTDIVIVGYDSNGINWRSRHNLQPSSSGGGDRAVSEALSKLLLKYQDVYTDSSSDGTMRALASAAKLVPYDSALFLITDKGAGDPQRLPLALRTLIEKRLKVYTIWTDPRHPSLDSELALQNLNNVSVHTDGEVLPYSIQVMEEDNSDNLASEAELQQWVPFEMTQPRHARLQARPEENFDTLLIRRGADEAISLGVPIESGISALRIHIEGDVEHAVIYPPNEEPQIDLNNITSVQSFSPASTTVHQSPREVYLVFPGTSNDDSLSVLPATPSGTDVSRFAGVWHLSVRCDKCDYRIRVSARSHIHFDVELQKRDMLKVWVTGPVASVRESVLVDEFGKELNKLSFSYQSLDGIQSGTLADISVDVPLPPVSNSKVYVKILGRDVKGMSFVRLGGPFNPQTEVRLGRSAAIAFPDTDLQRAEQRDSYMYSRLQHNDTDILPFGRATSQVLNQGGSILTSVQIGLSSRLYGAPGNRLQLHFEVTNYREESVRFNFGAVGELRFLTGIEPTSQTVAPGQTVNVIVTLVIASSAQPGARDLITFTAYGVERVSLSAYVYVLNRGESVTDVWPPEVRHNFAGSCIGRLGSDCNEHVWSATIIAQDSVGGLLRLSSSPAGLLYEGNFISGTREEVMATYRSTCCTPRVVVNAIDSFGNTNSYVIDISSYISGAGIAAIVLGVLLLIVIIVLISFCIYRCVKRRRQSKDLAYATSRNIS